MYSLTNLQVFNKPNCEINFNGGKLSSDSGLYLLHEFMERTGISRIIKSFKTKDTACRKYLDHEILLQKIYQICAGYPTDDIADNLYSDPVFNQLCGKRRLASQPTISRFNSRLDESTLEQFNDMFRKIRKVLYKNKQSEQIILDLDSTLLQTYGQQENNAYVYHYSTCGFHPLVCYDGLTGDLLKIALRKGNCYCSTGVEEFLQPVLDEFSSEYPSAELFLRADSGFATPQLYTQAETNGCSYVIRLKSNNTLHEKASHLEEELAEKIALEPEKFHVVWDEFYYQAASWDYPRRVVCKVEKRLDELFFRYTFIVTNMSLPPQDIVKIYCNRGRMENFIKESKDEFGFTEMSSHLMTTNANRLQVAALAYNIFNAFRRLCLPEKLGKLRANAIRLHFLKIASRKVVAGRKVIFKFCSSYPHIQEFYDVFHRIGKLVPQME